MIVFTVIVVALRMYMIVDWWNFSIIVGDAAEYSATVAPSKGWFCGAKAIHPFGFANHVRSLRRQRVLKCATEAEVEL